ncbi:MAG: metallophosphoesterase, partial [Actinobacteria bacterium]|nr:metallophosphoesterase [Actinomycetota bacterium]
PAVAVLGSNDCFQPQPKNPLGYFRGPNPRVDGPRMDTGRLAEGLAATGWRLVDNRRGLVDTVAGPLDVAGLGDPHIGLDDPGRVDWGRPEPGVALRLGVVHAPYLRALDVFDRHGYDLVLSGHTHGGQVRVPGVGALVTNCDLPPSQARGLSRHGADLWLHVSAGLGTSLYAPVRLACRPEATLVDVVPGFPSR